LEDRQRLDAAGVPELTRHPTSKTSLALELIEEARIAGISTAHVAPGIAWGKTEELASLIQERGLNWSPELASHWVEALRCGREELQTELGLDHFEGCSWRGFHHHACLVVLAYALSTLVRETTVGRD
jgi:hypothetical protein